MEAPLVVASVATRVGKVVEVALVVAVELTVEAVVEFPLEVAAVAASVVKVVETSLLIAVGVAQGMTVKVVGVALVVGSVVAREVKAASQAASKRLKRRRNIWS